LTYPVSCRKILLNNCLSATNPTVAPDYSRSSIATTFVGAGKVLVTADVSFDSGQDTGADDAIREIEATLREREDRVSAVYLEPEV
jgi:hypothetical protein